MTLETSTLHPSMGTPGTLSSPRRPQPNRKLFKRAPGRPRRRGDERLRRNGKGDDVHPRDLPHRLVRLLPNLPSGPDDGMGPCVPVVELRTRSSHRTITLPIRLRLFTRPRRRPTNRQPVNHSNLTVLTPFPPGQRRVGVVRRRTTGRRTLRKPGRHQPRRRQRRPRRRTTNPSCRGP